VTDRATLLSRLAQAVAREPAEHPLTWRVCHAAREVIGVDGASITMDNSAPGRVTLCATDTRSDLLENLQDVLGEGPCRDAFDFGRPMQTGLDRYAASRWPQFIPAAEKIVGTDAYLWAFPMHSAGDVVGTMNLYRMSRRPLVESIDSLQFLADTLAATLLSDPSALAELADASAWPSRAVVHQATGMLIAQLGVSGDDALAVLRSYAFANSAHLADVARAVVERKLDLTGR
jgi:ANTAR domain/GAF domain